MSASLLRALVAAAVVSTVPACGSPTEPDPPTTFGEGDVRILFVGNSLTYTNDLPGVVGTIADAAGESVAILSLTAGNYAIMDHWRQGLPEYIRELEPDLVVLQQGPSSLQDSRSNLIIWTDSVARVAAEVGARPALLMVWPELARYEVFPDVRESYRLAAEGVDGVFIPAGDAFKALRDTHPEWDPYGIDQFHPSDKGTVISAYVVVRALLGARVTGLPAQMNPVDPALPRISMTEDQARTFQELADAAVDAAEAAALNTAAR